MKQLATSPFRSSMTFASRPPLGMIFGAEKTVRISADGREEAQALISKSGTDVTWLISGNGKYPATTRGNLK